MNRRHYFVRLFFYYILASSILRVRIIDIPTSYKYDTSELIRPNEFIMEYATLLSTKYNLAEGKHLKNRTYLCPQFLYVVSTYSYLLRKSNKIIVEHTVQ